jgi:hypothetical protein
MHVDSPKAYTISDVDSIPAEMTTPLQLPPLRLIPVGTKAIDLDFDGGHLSSDAGLILLRDPDAPLGPGARGDKYHARAIIARGHTVRPCRPQARCTRRLPYWSTAA